MMGTKNYANAADLVDFARASTGTALRKISYGGELWTTPTISDLSVWAWDAVTDALYGTGDGTSDTARGDAVTAGGVYLVTYRITRTSGLCQVRLGNTFIETAGSTGTREKVIVAGDTTGLTFTDSGSFVGAVHNISVKEVLFDQPDGTLTLFNHPVDVPRIEYNADGTVRGLLVEEQRTNLVTYSEGSGTSSAPAGWSLLGSGSDPTATTLLNDLGGYLFTGGDRYIRSALSLSATTYTASVFIDPDSTYTGQIISLSGFTGATGSLTATAEDADENGRVFITFTLSGDVSGDVRIGQINSNSGELNIGGWQLEAGSFPTSYIPTDGSQATRAADICSIDVDQFGYNRDAGTFVVEFSYLDPEEDTTNYLLQSGSNARFAYNNVNNSSWYAYDGSVVNGYGSISSSSGAFYKIGIASNDFSTATVVDGSGLTTSSSKPFKNVGTTLGIGAQSNGAHQLNGHIKSIDYYPRRLTNEQLQELTS